jgi:hypothetical protein
MRDLHTFYTGFNLRDLKIIRDCIDRILEQGEEFEYPDYGGLPERISDRLTSDQVDYLGSFTDQGTEPSINDIQRILAQGWDGE